MQQAQQRQPLVVQRALVRVAADCAGQYRRPVPPRQPGQQAAQLGGHARLAQRLQEAEIAGLRQLEPAACAIGERRTQRARCAVAAPQPDPLDRPLQRDLEEGDIEQRGRRAAGAEAARKGARPGARPVFSERQCQRGGVRPQAVVRERALRLELEAQRRRIVELQEEDPARREARAVDRQTQLAGRQALGDAVALRLRGCVRYLVKDAAGEVRRQAVQVRVRQIEVGVLVAQPRCGEPGEQRGSAAAGVLWHQVAVVGVQQAPARRQRLVLRLARVPLRQRLERTHRIAAALRARVVVRAAHGVLIARRGGACGARRGQRGIAGQQVVVGRGRGQHAQQHRAPHAQHKPARALRQVEVGVGGAPERTHAAVHRHRLTGLEQRGQVDRAQAFTVEIGADLIAVGVGTVLGREQQPAVDAQAGRTLVGELERGFAVGEPEIAASAAVDQASTRPGGARRQQLAVAGHDLAVGVAREEQRKLGRRRGLGAAVHAQQHLGMARRSRNQRTPVAGGLRRQRGEQPRAVRPGHLHTGRVERAPERIQAQRLAGRQPDDDLLARVEVHAVQRGPMAALRPLPGDPAEVLLHIVPERRDPHRLEPGLLGVVGLAVQRRTEQQQPQRDPAAGPGSGGPHRGRPLARQSENAARAAGEARRASRVDRFSSRCTKPS